LCTFVLQVCDSDLWQAIDLNQWILEKINSKPKEIKSNEFINHLYQTMSSEPTQGAIKVVMFSGLHQPGLPSMLKYIKEDIKPDFAFWGRELDAQNEQDEALRADLGEIKTYFTLSNQKHYYSAPLISSNGEAVGEGKFKVISINSNYCYLENWSQLTKFQDPGHMLDWLEHELAKLEEINGAAIMLSPLPNSDECNRQFGRRWHALMDRYQNVVRWGMTGSNDHFQG